MSAAGAAPSPAGDGAAPALELPRPPGLLRRWVDAHPRTVDLLLAIATQGLLLPLALVASAFDDELAEPWWPMAGTVLVALALGYGTYARRRMPFALLLAALVAVLLPQPTAALGSIASWVALYALGVFRSARWAWIGFSVAAVVNTALLLGSAEYERFAAPIVAVISVLVQVTVATLVPTLIGLWIGGRRRYERALIARAEDLARERDQRTRLAVSEERTRIAREMHDIVSHGLTVMITLSEGAAAQALAGAATAPDAMRRVADTGRASLAEMRRLLGLLRDPAAPAELIPQPADADIDRLIAGFRDAGLPLHFTRVGAPLEGPSIPLAAYRIIQEALTNVLRHAPRSPRVDVRLENAADEIVIAVENEADPEPPEATGAGRGLIGMRERAALLGGSIDAGPRLRGGWGVLAVLRKEEA
ncbi:sensor histidine kinase [Microbacterium sediminis]|nr:histidine kinase [Microbacterium sediminis]QBR75226.1 two-component sensor histidine kinase [Microbacterium sediminis]